jgi:hypothetical protein
MRSLTVRLAVLVALALTAVFGGGWKWDVPIPH